MGYRDGNLTGIVKLAEERIARIMSRLERKRKRLPEQRFIYSRVVVVLLFLTRRIF